MLLILLVLLLLFAVYGGIAWTPLLFILVFVLVVAVLYSERSRW